VAVTITSYRPNRQFIFAGLAGLAIALFSGWVALRWEYAWVAASLAFLSSLLCFFMASRPAIEVHEAHLRVGRRVVPWFQIRKLDRIAIIPLVVQITLANKRRFFVIYAGDISTANSLLRHLRRRSREALIDGVPYKQFWGEARAAGSERKLVPPPRSPLLMPDDEAEVERLFQQLKTVGHLDQKTGSPRNRGGEPAGKED
jgi:hypothetical protein